MPLTSRTLPATTFSLDLVAPERQLVCRDVGMVTVPGAEGDFGVLPGHAPLVSGLRPGVVCVYDGGAITDRVFVSGGVAEVGEDHCIILAEEAQPLSELDAGTLETEMAAAQAAVEAASTTEEARAQALASVAVLAAKRAALAQHPNGSPHSS